MSIKWQAVVKTKASLLFQWYVFEGHREKYYKNSLKLGFGLENQKIVDNEISIDLNEFIHLEILLKGKINKEKYYLESFIKSCYQYSKKLLNTSTEIKKLTNLSDFTNQEILDLYLKYQKSVLDFMPFLNTILVIDSILKKEITKKLETRLNITNKQEQDLLISKLVIPIKKSFFVQENETLIKIAIKIQSDSNYNPYRDIHNFIDGFAWTSVVAYLGKYQNKNSVEQRLNNIIIENPKKKLVQIYKIKSDSLLNFINTYKIISKSKIIVNLIKIAREMLYLQTYRLDIFFIAHYNVNNLFNEIAKRFNFSINELVYLTGDEIISLIKERSRIKKKQIDERINNYALILENNKFLLLSGKQIKKTITNKVLINQVKGTIANRGRASGKAKLVFDIEDIPKVDRGDIIISPMTRPDLVPALMKSAGIITDFGGILCHAAIISREFGIPCIVGTEIATKVFQDGDLIEINAYEGLVRKI